MKSLLKKFKYITETIYNSHTLLQFIILTTFFNISLAKDNYFQCYISKYESNNNDLSVSSNENKEKEIEPVTTYNNSDILKIDILRENENRTGIYMWTNLITNKSYVGSAINLSKRLKNYYNISYLERETKTNNSMIYRALLKYGYSNFKLDIIEICKPFDLIKREQYYLDRLNPEYNVLKTAGSLLGFKHSKDTIERMRTSKLGRNRSEADKLAISAGNTKSQSVLVIDNNTGEKKEFLSIRKAAEFTGLHHSHIAKSIKINNKYLGKDYSIIKK